MSRARRSSKGYQKEVVVPQQELAPVTCKIKREPILAQTVNQGKYINAIKTSTITFGVGPAGSGKTFISTSLAADMLKEGDVEKIIITRPAVEAGDSMGHLPGELIEGKFLPYLTPLLEIFNDRLGKSFTEYLMKTGKIEAAPLGFMRGRTFSNCIVLCDEAENLTPVQMKLILTRIGKNCKMIINGDIRQKDIRGQSGLEDAIIKIKWIPQVSVIEFEKKDIVRSGICQEIVESYEKN